ncbi:Sodium-coupled neutral amino acid transporter 4 [Chelonia mydas]|uniref:Sodium-coupled neutral amino acid transporter 4 n=1 Tax=Chelonia mydas TaxID=8469 RepID=M7B231_CHEMY|nr:Sodium-coupled neutral amino acid transporter 4 [Chelonia mydas]
MDRMELQNVNIKLDEESNSGESIEDSYTDIIDPEKATISSQFANNDAESQKFLPNGFLGKKKLADYQEEYVIYKKSQIPCPLPVLENSVGNWTYNNNSVPMHLVMLPNESVNSKVNFMMDNTPGHTTGFEEAKDTLHTSGVEYEAHSDSDDMCQPKYFVFNSQTAYTIPILAFAFVCHPEVLPIYSELKDRSRKRMQNVSNISIAGMLIMYLLAALFGYLTFYGEVEDELLHTYTKVYTFDTPLLLVRLAVLVAVTLTVPIVLFPIRSSVTALLFPKRPFSWIRHFLIAAVILAFTNTLVIFVPAIKDIFGFIGAAAVTMLIFILPAAFYLRLVKKEPLRSPQKIGVSKVGGITRGGFFVLFCYNYVQIRYN